jgi:hypothetical protein
MNCAIKAWALGALALSSSAVAGTRVSTTLVLPDVPHVVSGELDLLLGSSFAIGVNAGGFGTTFNTSAGPTPVSISAFNARARWFPFSGTFFLGLAAGTQKAMASATPSFTVTDANSGQSITVPTAASATINSPYLSPHLGWFVVTSSGFTWGFELGAQVPFNSRSNIQLDITDPAYAPLETQVKATTSYQSIEADIRKTANQLGNQLLPYAAFRIGWTF